MTAIEISKLKVRPFIISTWYRPPNGYFSDWSSWGILILLISNFQYLLRFLFAFVVYVLPYCEVYGLSAKYVKEVDTFVFRWFISTLVCTRVSYSRTSLARTRLTRTPR